MSASESPDENSNASRESVDETPASPPESGEASSSKKASGARISQAPTVVGGEELEASMPDDVKPDDAKSDDAKSDDAKSDDAKSGVSEGEDAAAKVEAEAPEDPLEVAKADSKRIREQLIRTAADFDNFRKRSRREQEDATRRGREGVIKDLLPIFDNLERAAGHADQAQDVKSLSDGLRMVLKQFGQTLERIGIERVPSVGQPFDPSLHEAIQHLESTEHVAGVVMTEVQSGYQMGAHLIRACMVVVSKGPGPDAATESSKADSEDASEGSDDASEADAAAAPDEAPESSEKAKD